MFQCKITIVNHTLGNSNWIGEEWELGRGTERMGTGQGNRKDGDWIGEQKGWELVRGTERMGTGYGNRKDGNWVFNYSSQENLKKKQL